jgi:putative ABC transport system substrate-binding protein
MQAPTCRALFFALSMLATLALPEPGWAQDKPIRIGVLTFPVSADKGEIFQSEEPLRRTLAGFGWVDGKNVSLEFRRVSGGPDEFADSAADLVGRKVDIICADSAPATRAAHAATRSIPVIGLDFTNDPVAAGYVETYGRPGGNVTGVFLDAPGFAAKWLELLRGFNPKLSQVAVLWDPTPGAAHLEALRAAAPGFGIKLQVLEVRKPTDLEAAFAALRGTPQALIVLPSPMTWGESERLARLSRKHRLLATSMAPQFARAGGALTYGPDPHAALERMAVMVAKVLNGAKPAELPVERPAKFNLIVNARTVRELGLAVPEAVTVGADEVIR